MKKRFRYVTTVECSTKAEADQVMAERIGPDEDYGFSYTINYEGVPEGFEVTIHN